MAFYFGVDYYPEHWPQDRWPEDARLMAKAGFNVVRLAEFAWSYLEPRPSCFDFDWLDRALEVLQTRDIHMILSTPTASPPPWVMAMYPDAYRVLHSGQRQAYGNRREYCPTHPGYRERGRIVTQALAEHYAEHPAVIGWQIDNEFGDRCYCPICQVYFQAWLQEKYDSLDGLNAAWGTVFWSHVYTDWSQIPVPAETGGSANPGLDLDYRRFMSDTYVHFQQEQIDILRQTCPNHFVTHNLMGFGYDRINYFDLARELDFVAWDNYPRGFRDMQAEVDPSLAALSCDTMRGLRHQNYWVMEQQSGPSGWEVVGLTPRPGELRLWAYQSIAHGADAVVFFRWRTARFGTEEYWHGVLDHHGRPGRRYEELKRVGGEIENIGARIHGSLVKPVVAMILSYDSRFAFQLQPNNPKFDYSSHFYAIYRALHRWNVPVEIVAPTDDLTPYKLVIAPALYVLPEQAAVNLKRFVESGGLLVVTPRTGVKDEANRVVDQRLPGLLAELCGVEVDEYDSLPADVRNELEFALPELASASPAFASVWCDVLKPTAATVVARYTQAYYAGQPAITLNRTGQGQAVYVGTFGDAGLYAALARWLLDLVDVQPLLAAPEGVEVTERWQDDQRLLFLLNHTERSHEIAISGCYEDLIGDSVFEDSVTIASRDVLVLVETRKVGD
jgi:beta-galactosidase